MSIPTMLPLLLLCLTMACQSPGARQARLNEVVARDSAQFAAVVDTLNMAWAGYVFGITPVPLDMDSAVVYGSDSIREELTRIIMARRTVLVARDITILNDATEGKCPGIFTDDPGLEFCPSRREQRIAIGLAHEARDSSLTGPTVSMGIVTNGLGPGGSSFATGDYILEFSNGRWRVVRKIPGLAS